ncbi:MAG: TIGR03854 family LLM class F420-dependent oxidoreductase [Acidimicrobiia bacterium]|nr:TIGR03854 family LLM class F420-dependent oxidoreductase [Acidimicrobiia bacterium]MBV9039520.1 TIGR03854 family LLM class F420-dependent oxidoreductase [Acidimicrobiia bacterium]
MKIRIGFGLGTRTALDAEPFASLVDALEDLGFDSLWLSERLTGPAPDPLVGLAVAAGRTRKLKLGTSVMVLPGRNPALVASEWASLDRLSGGRTLPAFGLGVADPAEQQAFGVERGERAAWFDEALPLIRRFWTEDHVDHDGARFTFRDISVRPKPVQSPPDVWLGGIAPSELRRVGRLGDGWLPSFCTPSQAAEGRVVVESAAADAGRSIDSEHFGALLFYARGGVPNALARIIAARRPGVDPADLVAVGLPALRAVVDRFCDVGFSKFVVVPMEDAPSWPDELAEIADALLPLQTGAAMARP